MAEDDGDRAFDRLFNRVYEALNAVKESMNTTTSDNPVASTRRLFRRRRGHHRNAGTSESNVIFWNTRLFLVEEADQCRLPSAKLCARLNEVGLGVPVHERQGQPSCINMSWSLQELQHYICQSFPIVSLNLIGYQMAKVNRYRTLVKFQAGSLRDIRRTVGRSRLYLIPNTTIILPSSLTLSPVGELNTVPSTVSTPPTSSLTVPSTVSTPPTSSLSVPSTVSTPPTSSLTVPSTVSTPPTSSLTVPSTVSTPPTSSLTVTSTVSTPPTSSLTVPSTVSTPPTSSLTVPSTVSTPPTSSLTVPSTVSTPPTSSLTVPSTVSTPPTSSLTVPSTVSTSRTPSLGEFSFTSRSTTTIHPDLGTHQQDERLDPALWVNAGTPEVFYRVRHLPSNVCASLQRDDFMVDLDSSDDDVIEVVSADAIVPEQPSLETVLLSFLAEQNMSQEDYPVIVRRRHVLRSAIKAVQSPHFNWRKTPNIAFIGEEGDDYGGPRREFFRLVMLQLSTWGIFEGSAGQLFFQYDQTALEAGKYRLAGKLMAWSVVHGGPGLRCLNKTLYEFMCGQEPVVVEWEKLPYPDVKGNIQRILDCRSEEDFEEIKTELGDWFFECGLTLIYTAGLPDIPKIIQCVVKHYTFLRVSNMVSEFTRGMDDVGHLWQCCRENWHAFIAVFTDSHQPLTRATFRKLFSINYSLQGSNQREDEEETIYSWELFINMVDAKDTDVSFEDIMVFITGADAIPTLGFPSKPTIDFFDREEGVRRFPYASTCSLQLCLPRGVANEEEMAQLMSTAVKCGMGFGKA